MQPLREGCWGEHTCLGGAILIVQVLDVIFPSFTHCLLSVMMFDRWNLGLCLILAFWDDKQHHPERRAKFHKWDFWESRCWRMCSSPMLTASSTDVCTIGKQEVVQQWSCDVLQLRQHQPLRGFYDHRRHGNRPLVV